jgi:DNA-binding LacI/PurR family transcriptional regulator
VTTSLHTQLSAALREQIRSGSLRPGTQLPTELTLATEHGVSRGTVRQAMDTLVREGYVERIQGRGTFVRVPPPDTPQPSSRRIGLVLPYMRDQLMLDIIVGVEHAVKARGYQVSFAYADERLEQEARDIARLRADGVAGLIIFPVSNVLYDESIWELRAAGVPLVLVDRYFPDLDTDFVIADNRGGTYRATEHLIILGHTSIAFAYPASVGLHTTAVNDRFVGYQQALADYGLAFDERLVWSRPHSSDAQPALWYAERMREQARPTAAVGLNDHEALALLGAAQEASLRVPEDIAVVGFDDLPHVAHLRPPLTTVAQPREDIGLQAGTLLINRIEGYDGPPRRIRLPTSLVVRESCGAKLRVRQSIGG